MKLWLAVPGYDGKAVSEFKRSLDKSAELMKENGIDLVNLDVLLGCCYLPIARNKLAKRFMDSDAEVFMFLDSDLSWNPYHMIEFLQQDYDIVAGIYRHKLFAESYPVHIFVDEHARPIINPLGLIKAEGVPTGFLKIKRNVFEKFIEHYGADLEIDEPDENMQAKFSYWNFFDCEKVGRQWIGEDYNFCRKWLAIGGEIWVYPDIILSHHGTDGHGNNFSFTGNYHEYLLRCPGGSKCGPVQDQYKENDIDGWMTPPELQFLYQESSKYESVVEIGSFKGRSAHALLSGLAKKVTCIDTWNYFKDGVWSDNNIYQEFLDNVKKISNNGRLQIIRDLSVNASKQFDDKSIDMVFIDAGHSVEDVRSDIEAWFPKAKKIICGHDYNWPGVQEAVDNAFGQKIKLIDSIWYVEL